MSAVTNVTMSGLSEDAYDLLLASRIKQGDALAFEKVVTRYQHRLLAVAMSITRDKQDAQEIVQDAFLRALKHIAKFRYDYKLSSWLNIITVNLARNHNRINWVRKRSVMMPLDNPVGSNAFSNLSDILASNCKDPERELEMREFAVILAGCLARLKPEFREAIVLRNIRHLTYEEISATLGVGIGTVKSRIARAREGLVEMIMDQYCEFDSTISNMLLESSEKTGTLGSA